MVEGKRRTSLGGRKEKDEIIRRRLVVVRPQLVQELTGTEN